MVAATRPKRGPEGQAKGTVATNPREVDSIVRGNLGKIYAGNAKNGSKMTQDYMEDYKKHIFRAKTSRAEKLTGADLHKAAADAKESGAGGDQWGPVDLKKWSPLAFDILAEMLNAIEEGATWPKQMQNARAAFMSKDEEDTLNPAAYRVLLMLPAVYRLWARTRLAHLQPWVEQWSLPEMFAGIEGQGAEEAAYSTAL